MLLFGIGIIIGTSPMMAEAIGRKHRHVRDIRRTFRQGLWSAVIISVPVWLMLWQTEAILLLFGQEAQVVGGCADVRACAAVGLSASARLRRAALVRLGAAAADMGVDRHRGTVIVQRASPTGCWCSAISASRRSACTARASRPRCRTRFMFVALALIVVFHRSFRRYHVFGNWWRADWPRLATIWRLGLPIGASLTFEMTVFSAAILMIGQFGTDAIAAHSIVFQIASVSFMVPMGLGAGRDGARRPGLWRAGRGRHHAAPAGQRSAS